jgi:hypothetical protein
MRRGKKQRTPQPNSLAGNEGHRRFPPPWSGELIGRLLCRPRLRGQALAYEPGRRVAKLLSKDEARRIAANIAKLPELPRKA